jgi:GSH-dependent disulfide-bond oxidoreductase
MTQSAALFSTSNPVLSHGMFELRGARTGNCFRAAIGLCEAGVPFRVHRINFKSDEHHSAEHLALNPAGKAPVLVRRRGDGSPDFVLTQSNAILMLVAEWAPGRLIPLETEARANVDGHD